MELRDKVAIITGGATGIGLGISREMAAAGAAVAIASRNKDKLVAATADIKETSGNKNIVAVPTDITCRADLEKLVACVLAEFGQLDILVNNAAMITPYTPLLDVTEDFFENVLRTNLTGALFAIQAAAKPMIARSYGKIINITSMAALGTVTPGLVPYIVSKVGLNGLTMTCARELGPMGINVNAIAAGRVHTQMSHEIRSKEQIDAYLEYGKKAAILGRLGLPEDIAHLSVFLASDKASFIAGQILHCDGGRMDRM